MSDSQHPTSGIKFGNYEVVANDDGTPLLLGGGAYGKTYKALHSFLGTTVALKVIHDSFAFDAGVKKRFLAEARAIAQLKHPHIAQVIDCGEDDGTLYYAMEYCDGGDLEKLVNDRGALADETVLLLAKQAAKALAYVHDQKFLHRDLKPSNLMLSMVAGRDEANLKVIDFGLVKALGQENAANMTQTGQFLGTLLYASPEQLREEELDQRTDIFSLGLTLWFLLEGGLPLKGAPAQVVTQRLSGKGYDALLPKESHEVVRKLLSQMMHPVRDERIPDMHAVLAGISDCLSQIHGTGQILLAGKGSKTGTMPKLAATGTSKPRVQLATSIQRMTSQFELGEEDKELQTDLGVRCRGRWIQMNEPVHLTIVRKALAADVTVVQKLDELVAKASISEGPFLIRPQSLVQFVDQLVLAEEYVEGLSLLNVLRARRQLSFADASPILRQLAEACDLAAKGGLSTLELVAHRVLFQFPRQSVQGMSGGGVEKLIMRPVAQWPKYLLRVAPAYTEAQRTSSSHMTNVRAPSMHGGATMVANADDDADSPSRFARLTYRVLSGHPVPVAALMAQAAYVPIAGLSEEGNRLLAGIISRETPISDCLSFLQQLWRVEGMAEAGLTLPMPADQLTNLRQAMPSEPPLVAPVTPAIVNPADVVIIDPFTNRKVTATPPPAPRGSPAATPPARQTAVPPAERPPEQAPIISRTPSTPQVRPLGANPPPQAGPAAGRPLTSQPAIPVAPASTPPRQAAAAPQARTAAPAPQARPPTSAPAASPDLWGRPATSTPAGRSATATPPVQQQPAFTPPVADEPLRHVPPPQPPIGRSPHLPPPREGKPLPLKLIGIIAGCTVLLAGAIFGVMQALKPDQVQLAIQNANGKPDALIDGLKPLVNARVITAARLEQEVRRLETTNSVGAGEIFNSLHRYYIDNRFADEDRLLIADFKDSKNVEDAWDAFLKNAEEARDLPAQLEVHLHRSVKADSPASRAWIVKQDLPAFQSLAADKLSVVIEQFRHSLSGSSPDEKKVLLPRLATLLDQSKGFLTKPNADNDWEIYNLFKEHGLASEPEAAKRLESAAQSGKEEPLTLWLAQIDPAKALDVHLKLAPARDASLAEIASRFIASTSPAEQKKILEVLNPLRAKVAANLQSQLTRKLAEVEIAAVPSISWSGRRDIYQKHGLKDEARRELETAAKAGDEEAVTLIQDELVKNDPTKQWEIYPKRVLNGSTRLAQDAFRWLLNQKDADLIAHAQVVTPLLEKKTPAAGAKLTDDEVTIVRKVAVLRAAGWSKEPDAPFKLFQFYDSYKLAPEATEALKQAADKNIEPAMLELARRAPEGAAKLTAFLNCAEKKQNKEAIDWVLGLKPTAVPADTQPRVVSVLEKELTTSKADRGRAQVVVAALVGHISADKSLNEADRERKLRGYYKDAGMDDKVQQMDKDKLQKEFTTLTASLAKADAAQRKAALEKLHSLTSSAIGPDVIAWLLKNIVVKPATANFTVVDPLDETKAIAIPPALWKEGSAITLEKLPRYFTLPATLPPIMASAERHQAPTGSKDGLIINPYDDKTIAVSRALWFPGAEIIDPATDRKFLLPEGLQLMVARFIETKGEPVIENPFDPKQSTSLATWTTEKDWSRWKAADLIITLEGQPKRQYKLPPMDEVPSLVRVVALDRCDVRQFTLTSPFTGGTVPFTVNQWRSATSIEDLTMKALGLKATIELPPASQRPVLEAKLTDKPFQVIDPYDPDGKVVTVHWSQWLPGQAVTQLRDGEEGGKSSKSGKSRSSDKEVRFKLPADLGANANPGLEGSSPDRINHFIVSPYGGHKVTVEQKDWQPGTLVKDSEYAHLSLKMPASLGGEWFEEKEATLVDGSYLKVRSPYGKQGVIEVSTKNWESGKAKDEENENLPFKMPSIKDPALTAKVVSDFKFQIKNPYTGDTETWGESNWRDGASKTWAGHLTYRLPSPVPKFEIKTASYVGDRVVRSPYEGGGTKKLEWSQLASGTTTTDDTGRPMRVPSISDPRLTTKATKQNGKVSLVNPYTGSAMTANSSVSAGDSIPSGISGFTIKISDMTEIRLKPYFVLQNFNFKLDPKTLWYLGTPGQVMGGGNPRDLEIRLNSDRNARSLPSDYRFYYDADNRRMIARPKE